MDFGLRLEFRHFTLWQAGRQRCCNHNQSLNVLLIQQESLLSHVPGPNTSVGFAVYSGSFICLLEATHPFFLHRTYASTAVPITHGDCEADSVDCVVIGAGVLTPTSLIAPVPQAFGTLSASRLFFLQPPNCYPITFIRKCPRQAMHRFQKHGLPSDLVE